MVNLINADKGCKHVYWQLINTKLNKQNYNNEIKWMAQDLFRTERGDRLSWTAIYYMAFKSTLDSHLRTFQFKIINRILITNRQLKLYKIKNSEHCEFCRVETATYEHLFF